MFIKTEEKGLGIYIVHEAIIAEEIVFPFYYKLFLIRLLLWEFGREAASFSCIRFFFLVKRNNIISSLTYPQINVHTCW